ncbi:MAG: response regulator [Pseudomonadota bacterium]
MDKPKVDGQGKTILLIDDETEILELTQIYLEKMSFKVVACNDPNNLEDIVAKNHIDAAVSDYQMPNKNGLECAKILRKLKGPLFPIIMVTAYLNTKITEHQARKEGLNDILEKPINFYRLAQIINRELKRFKLLKPEDFETIELQCFMTPLDESAELPENKKRITVVELAADAIYLEAPANTGKEGKEYFFQVVCQNSGKMIDLNFRGKISCVDKLTEAFDMLTVVSKEIDPTLFKNMEKIYEEKQNQMNDFLKQTKGY